jgi:hypothetical protein
VAQQALQMSVFAARDGSGSTIDAGPGFAHSRAHPTFDHVWTEFSRGIEEVINARVWEGIHFRNSDEQGMRAGRCVGRFVIRHALRPRGDRDRGEAKEDRHGRLRCDNLGLAGGDDRDDDRDR